MSKKEVKLKANLLDLVGPLLQQLKKEVKNDNTDKLKKGVLTEIVEYIGGLKKCLCDREDWETQLIGHIGQIERQLDWWTSEKYDENRERDTNVMFKLKDKLIELLNTANVLPIKDDEENCDEVNGKDKVDASSNSGKDKVDASSNSGKDEQDDVGSKKLTKLMKELNPPLRDCLYSLGIFPVSEKLKKRLLVYWWIGLGLVPLQENESRTTERYAEFIFDDLMDQGILMPDETKKLLPNQEEKWCIVQPILHKQLIYTCARYGLFKSEERKEGTVCFYGDGHASNNNIALLNFKQKYLDSEDIKNVLDGNRALKVLQFGWWRNQSKGVDKTATQEMNSHDHIEVDGIDFLKHVGENLTYLSLRGISGIEELPQNIGKLENLMILDLRACHNLEKLPEKPRSILNSILPKVVKSKLHEAKWFKNLKNIDMSECYLLAHMPKWMCELSNLEVLKGFVTGSAEGRNDQFCRIGDLSKLKKLRKLSIKMAKLSEDSMDFKHLEKLSVLTIAWKLDDYSKAGTISFPENLEKLDIRCYPSKEAKELFLELEKLKKLKKLYIRGGNLTKLIDPNSNALTVEMLRLRFLQLLELRFTDLHKICPKLECVEYDNCTKLVSFPEGTTCYVFPYAC